MKLKPYLICTEYKGVFYGELPEGTDLTPKTLTGIENAKMAIDWQTTKGVMELAHTGPNKDSKIGAPARIEVLHAVTSVFAISDAAAKQWAKY